MARIEALVKQFEKLKVDLEGFMPLIKNEMFNYRMLESQESQQIAINDEWKRKNVEAEENFRKVVDATRTVEDQNKELSRQAASERNAQYVRMLAKYKEVEKLIDDSDKARIKKTLKEMEAVAA